MPGYFAGKMSRVFLIGFVLSFLSINIFAQNMFRKVNDFDGDGKSDFAVTRNENGQKYWYVFQSTGGYSVYQFGADTDVVCPGDYDNDGKTDYAIHRRYVVNPGFHQNELWIRQSLTNSVVTDSFNTNANWDTKPFPQDFTGTGRTDRAFLINYLGDPSHKAIFFRSPVTLSFFAPNGYLPIRIGDLSGDGKADFASYNATGFNFVQILNSSTNNTQSLQFGITGDVYVPADFDGDGKGDLTIFRESDGNWWWLRSSDSSIQTVHWGTLGDVPVPGDYDGDGKTDLAIWRKGVQSYYWVYGSQSGPFVFGWGLQNDQVVTY